MKTKTLMMFVASLLILGCKKPDTECGESEYKSEAYKLVIQHIDGMTEKAWDKKVYTEIKDNQIPTLKKESERSSALSKLDAEYSKILVRDAKNILESGCPKGKQSHTLYDRLNKELENYPNIPGLKELKALKSKHDEFQKFAYTAVGRQKVESYRTDYDYSYEIKKIDEAKKLLQFSTIKCKTLRSSIEKLTKTSGYKSRRDAYCKAVFDSYMLCNDSSQKEVNIAKYNIDIHSDSKIKEKMCVDMDQHYEELNSRQQ